MRKILLLGIVLFGFVSVHGQTNLATWNFDSQYPDPLLIPTVYSATAGTGTIYLDGTNGSSIWAQTELDDFSGTALNDSRGTPTASFTLTLKNQTANGKQLVIKLSTLNYVDPIITFATAGSGSGFDTHQWAYSINGTDFTNFGSNTVNNTSTYSLRTLDMSAIDVVDNIPNLYLRLTVTGATSSSGNNKIDNLKIAASSTLPISLTSFTAKAIDKTVLLNWTTSSEKNNQQFEVLKSADGKNFKTITTLDGAGNSESEKSYSFTDENPYSGANYYQLKQSDFNGTTSVSNVISANVKIEDIKLSAYTSNREITVNVNSPNQTEGKIALFDMNGRKLDSKTLILNKGYNEIVFTKYLTPGTYFINLISAGKSTSFKFIK